MARATGTTMTGPATKLGDKLVPAKHESPKTKGTAAGAYHQVQGDRVLGAYGETPRAGRGQRPKLGASLKGYGKVGKPFR